jgi:hypothetical protein
MRGASARQRASEIEIGRLEVGGAGKGLPAGRRTDPNGRNCLCNFSLYTVRTNLLRF